MNKSPEAIAEELTQQINTDLYPKRSAAIIAAAIEARDAEHAAELRVANEANPFNDIKPTDHAPTGDELIDRLRGIYIVPVNDGAGLLNGKDTFERRLATSPIMHRAADRIAELRKELADAKEVIRRQNNAAAVWKKEEDYHLGRDR